MAEFLAGHGLRRSFDVGHGTPGSDAYGFSPMIALATKAVIIPNGRFTSSR
jgi:hypothetical protein